MVFFQKVFAYLKLHWVVVSMFLLTVWNYASPTVKDFIHNHPSYSFLFGLVGVIVAFFWRSPLISQGGVVPMALRPKPQ